MPGRIAGETTDLDGKRGFVLTLQTREQHIRREQATSNICTSQALNALGGVVYLAWLGRQGIVELGDLLLQRTAYARERLRAVAGVEPLHDAAGDPRVRGQRSTPRSRRWSSTAPPAASTRACRSGRTTRSPDGLLVAITEQRTRADIDRLAELLARASADRARAPRPRRVDGAAARAADDLREGRAGPPRLRRARARRARAPARRAAARRACAAREPPRLPEVSEPEIVRHYVRLSQAQLRPRLAASTRSAPAR